MDIVCIDTAHGHSAGVLQQIEKIRVAFPGVQLIAGNVATGDGARALIEAGAEVNNALSQWQNARARIAVSHSQIAELENAVRSTMLLMTYSDTGNYLEVLTARQTLLSAQLDETRQQFDKIQGVINLYHALGGGD